MKNLDNLKEQKSDKEIKLDNYHQINQSIKKGQVVITGSSLMEMFSINKFISEIGSNKLVYNRGVGGFTTDDLLEALDICVFELEPARIFINIGTNDLSDSRIPINSIINNYDKILNAIEERLPNIEIYLMAYFPVNYDAASSEMKECIKIRNNEKINMANLEVEKLANRHKKRYIDINKNLKDSEGRLRAEYTIEGLHINENGYRAIFDDMMKYINEPCWQTYEN